AIMNLVASIPVPRLRRARSQTIGELLPLPLLVERDVQVDSAAGYRRRGHYVPAELILADRLERFGLGIENTSGMSTEMRWV
ncbi:MAG: hypothetical protein AAB263_15875, partial [Planctomycetota bacterium]